MSHFHKVELDSVIEVMNETGRDMSPKYRETSTGGLAARVKCE
jgi:L-serine dehydratase